MLSILYRDDDVVVINKPSGLLVHRTGLDFHETENALKLLKRQLNCHIYPTHRLDKATSGALIFALNQNAARTVNLAFDNHQVRKTYVGVVRGYTEAAGHIDYPLEKLHDHMVDGQADEDPVSQDAVTDYTRLATVELPHAVGRYPTARYSLVALYPQTGRRHQLRRHMKHIFHPLVGDTTYGDGKHNAFLRETFDCNRLCLHCLSMEFPHPADGRQLTVTAPTDNGLNRLLDALGWTGIVPRESKDAE